MNMKVTIITPSFNQAEFLEKTINSVLGQDYPDLEYIIIDGGSTDGSVEIIKKYEKSLAYWVSEKDKGQSEAINKGFRRARGDIVGWINSDDYYEPGCIREVVRGFKDNPDAGLVYTGNNLVDENDKPLGLYSVPNITLDNLLDGNPNVVQPGSFYKKAVLDKVGLLDESLHYVMDYELWLRIAGASGVIRIPRALASFRWHSKSKTRSQQVAVCLETLEVRKRYGINEISWKNRIIIYRLLREGLSSRLRKGTYEQ